MVDPTSDLCEDVDPDEAPTCEICGEPIVEDPAHVVVSRVVDGSVETRHFCDADCRAAT